MITPSYGLTATERVLPSFTLDWTTGLVQSTVDVTRAGVATFVGSNGLIQSASADTQRIDYNTGVAGLLVEESRTNGLLQSADFNTTWTKHGTADVTSDQNVAPDGTTTADLLTGATDIIYNGNNIRQNIGASANTAYTLSIYVKAPSTNAAATFSIGLRDGASGAISSASVVPTSSWQRLSVSRTMGSTTVGCGALLGGADGDVLIWGAQLEAGAFPTSYIPTTSSAVTRNADVATVTGTNFSDFWNATEGTIVATGVLNGDSLNRDLVIINDATDNNRHMLRWSGVSQAQYAVITGGVAQLNIAPGGYSTVGTQYRRAIAYKQDNFAQAINGVLVGTSTSGNVPVVDRMFLGGNSVSAANLNGWVRSFYYYPHRLTNAEITAFSK